jgi:hypothetical protein
MVNIVMSNSDKEQILGIFDKGLYRYNHGGAVWFIAMIFTNKRIIAIDSRKFNKWLEKNGEVNQANMVENLIPTLSKWRGDFQIPRDKVKEIKVKPKRKKLFLTLDGLLEIKTNSIFSKVEIGLKDNETADKIYSLLPEWPQLSI